MSSGPFRGGSDNVPPSYRALTTSNRTIAELQASAAQLEADAAAIQEHQRVVHATGLTVLQRDEPDYCREQLALVQRSEELRGQLASTLASEQSATEALEGLLAAALDVERQLCELKCGRLRNGRPPLVGMTALATGASVLEASFGNIPMSQWLQVWLQSTTLQADNPDLHQTCVRFVTDWKPGESELEAKLKSELQESQQESRKAAIHSVAARLRYFGDSFVLTPTEGDAQLESTQSASALGSHSVNPTSSRTDNPGSANPGTSNPGHPSNNPGPSAGVTPTLAEHAQDPQHQQARSHVSLDDVLDPRTDPVVQGMGTHSSAEPRQANLGPQEANPPLLESASHSSTPHPGSEARAHDNPGPQHAAAAQASMADPSAAGPSRDPGAAGTVMLEGSQAAGGTLIELEQMRLQQMLALQKELPPRLFALFLVSRHQAEEMLTVIERKSL